jgi:acyl-CoA thioester hydrolase
MAFEISTPVTFRDVDVMKHVNNAVYLTWMETARTEYYLEIRPGMKIADLDIIVARVTCEYKRGARHGETVVVRVWPSHVGTTSFTLGYRLLVGQETVALGSTVQVCFDYAKQAKKPIPPDLRKRLEAELEPDPLA